jgi:hypothetical protein
LVPIATAIIGGAMNGGGSKGGGAYSAMPSMTQTQTNIQETRVTPVQTTAVNVQVAGGDIQGGPPVTPPFPVMLPIDPNLPGVASLAASGMWPSWPTGYPPGMPMYGPAGAYPPTYPGAAPSAPFVSAGLPDVGATALKIGTMKIPWWAVILAGAGGVWWLFFSEPEPSPDPRPAAYGPAPMRRVTLREVPPRRQRLALTA